MENECKKSFFSILKNITRELKETKDKNVIVDLLKSLSWKYSARDHFHIQDLQLLNVIHNGNTQIKKSWGKLIKSPFVQNANSNVLSYEILKMFENIFLITLSRIVKPDVGSQIKVSGEYNAGGVTSPSLVSAISVIDTNVTEKLVH